MEFQNEEVKNNIEDDDEKEEPGKCYAKEWSTVDGCVKCGCCESFTFVKYMNRIRYHYSIMLLYKQKLLDTYEKDQFQVLKRRVRAENTQLKRVEDKFIKYLSVNKGVNIIKYIKSLVDEGM